MIESSENRSIRNGAGVVLFNLLSRIIMSFALALATLTGTPSAVASLELTRTNEDRVQTRTRKRRAKASIDIGAPVEVVWRAIHEERDHDPEVLKTTVISAQGPEIVLEQTYRNIPIFGTVVCRTKNKETLYKRIDYWLDYSDHFKVMEGSWVLTPIESGCATRLELSSYLDAGGGIPRMLYVPFAPSRLLKRLKLVKALAEHEQSYAQ